MARKGAILSDMTESTKIRLLWVVMGIGAGIVGPLVWWQSGWGGFAVTVLVTMLFAAVLSTRLLPGKDTLKELLSDDKDSTER